MGLLVPVAAFIAANAATITAVTAVAGVGLSVAATQQAAAAKRAELQIAGREEASAARDREVQRKTRINTILGAQAAAAGAKGVQLSGSVANISLADAKQAARDSRVDTVNTQGRVNALSRRSRSISRVANLKSGASIFRAGERIVGRI